MNDDRDFSGRHFFCHRWTYACLASGMMARGKITAGSRLLSGSLLYNVQFDDFAGFVGNLETVDALSVGDAAE